MPKSNPRTLDARYEQLLIEASKLAPTDTRPLRVLPWRATMNAEIGLDAVLGRATSLVREPDVELSEILVVSDLGSAMADAAMQVDRLAALPPASRALIAQAHELRSLLLTKGDRLVTIGVFPLYSIRGIRDGRDTADAATDCAALAALFREYASDITGRLRVSSAELAAAESIGDRLQRVGCRPPPSQPLADATRVRDQLWTLFDEHWYTHVWGAGASLFGLDVEIYVPMLYTTRGRRARPRVPPPPHIDAATAV